MTVAGFKVVSFIMRKASKAGGQRSRCERREQPIRCTVRLAEQPIVVGMASNPEPHDPVRGFGGKRAVV